jgi:DNA-binding transcriptional ArsR family regulator
MFQNHVFRIGADEMRVELDKKSLFALASDTRLDILRALQPMRRTLTQLSESLNIDKAAVHRHLKKMEEGGLVKKFEDHGFVYYGLSWKARDILSPGENTRIILLLSCTWILVMVVAFLIAAGLAHDLGNSLFPSRNSDEFMNNSAAGEELGSTGYNAYIVWVMPAAGIGLIALVTGTLGIRLLVRPKQRTGDGPADDDKVRDAPVDD